jgi:hypothetical protein
MEAILITTDNKKKKVIINTFDEAKRLVCDYDCNSSLQIVILNDGSALILDEEGKLKNLSFNEIATNLAHENNGIYPSDYIVGDVLVVELDDFDNLPYE